MSTVRAPITHTLVSFADVKFICYYRIREDSERAGKEV